MDALSWLVINPLSPDEPVLLTDFDCLALVPLEFLGLSLGTGHTVCFAGGGGDDGGDRLVNRLLTPLTGKTRSLLLTVARGDVGGLDTLLRPLELFVP